MCNSVGLGVVAVVRNGLVSWGLIRVSVCLKGVVGVFVFELLLGTEISKGRVTCLICLNGSVLLKLLDVRSMVVGVGVVVVSISVLIAAV